MSRSQSPFDPFSINEENVSPRDEVSQTNTNNVKGTGSHSSNTSRNRQTKQAKHSQQLESVKEHHTGTKPLPPRLNVRLTLHEEVSSTAVADTEGGNGGSLSQLSIEGKITARVESSNANENTPFGLQIGGPMSSLANITCNDYCDLLDIQRDEEDESQFAGGRAIRCKVNVPKSEKSGCEILTYQMSVRTQNMPILVQAKATVKANTCKVSVQIRSNLSNQGDLSNFTIIVAIPPILSAETVKVTRGESGVWDETKRIITWKIGSLSHGESYLVSAEADVRMSPAVTNMIHDNPFNTRTIQDKVHCPVLVRCLSEVDQVSDLTLLAMPLQDDPATIVQNQISSYQLLHRVGNY